ncbi:hypothetical protein F4554_003721 [Actinopolymorpha rutila]|uniref:ANTAR domain-containing protein n=1 Tax=Actinopolymorpha rutila TaxID=446787 RepID=A0A852ZFI7_9ACTN|nr:hypothetical protein [Actinopolymorpha rutila]
MMCLRLFTYAHTVGALNLYARSRNAFGRDDVEQGQALAAHAAVAVVGAQRIDQLSVALDTRTVIAQAQGILMERYRFTADQAFNVLVRVSSQANVKLRDVAIELVETRRTPGYRPPEPPDADGVPLRELSRSTRSGARCGHEAGRDDRPANPATPSLRYRPTRVCTDWPETPTWAATSLTDAPRQPPEPRQPPGDVPGPWMDVWAPVPAAMIPSCLRRFAASVVGSEPCRCRAGARMAADVVCGPS